MFHMPLFESLVNSVRCKTARKGKTTIVQFESLVNSVRCKTLLILKMKMTMFESLVNSVRCKTENPFEPGTYSLRALLIQ